MAQNKHLENAPIQEAIIDIKVKLSEPVDTNTLLGLEGRLPDDYMNFEPTIRRGLGVEFGEDGVRTTHDESLIGYKAESKGRNFVVQFQGAGITVSKLAPYIDWDEFKAEAQIAWNLYKKILPKYKFSRVATRFINRLELPLTEGFHFEEYLTSNPKMPNSMGNGEMAEFFTRVVVTRPESNATAIIIQNSELPVDGILPVVIDIDVFRDSGLTDNDDVWAILDSLRIIKNEAFFGSVSESTLELCK